MAATSVISDEREARQIEAKLEAQRSIVVEALAVVAQAEAERDNLLVDRELGQRIPDRDIERLESRISETQQQIRLSERVIAGLRERLAAWQGEERRRRHDAAMRRLKEISAAAPNLERQFIEAARVLVTISTELRRLGHDFNAAERETLTSPGLRRPAMPPAIPAVYFSDPAPYVGFDQWLREEIDHRGLGKDN